MLEWEGKLTVIVQKEVGCSLQGRSESEQAKEREKQVMEQEEGPRIKGEVHLEEGEDEMSCTVSVI